MSCLHMQFPCFPFTYNHCVTIISPAAAKAVANRLLNMRISSGRQRASALGSESEKFILWHILVHILQENDASRELQDLLAATVTCGLRECDMRTRNNVNLVIHMHALRCADAWHRGE